MAASLTGAKGQPTTRDRSRQMSNSRLAPAPNRPVIPSSWLFATLALVATVIFVVRLPQTLLFDNFAFFDAGANLAAQSLINEGYRPISDFFYHYGLLSLLFGRVWFGILGLTPLAGVSAIPLFDFLIIWGFVRIAANLKLNMAGSAIVLLTAPITIPSSLLNFAHAIEPTFLIHILADVSGGHRRRALALTMACVFVKPSMAYFVGFCLLGLLVVKPSRKPRRILYDLIADLYPAALVGICFAVLLSVTFGPTTFLRSVVPAEGANLYREQGFGFFNGAGRSFLMPRGAPWSYYLANIAGIWILYSAGLIVAALLGVQIYLDNERQPDHAPEVVIICAILHLSFVCFFFGNELSWIYYFYIPVIGLAAAARFGVGCEVAIFCLALTFPAKEIGKEIVQHLAPNSAVLAANVPSRILSVPAYRPVFTYQLWFTTAPSAETDWLWAAPQERTEWTKVLTMVRGSRTALLSNFGGADVIFPEFSPPVTLFFCRGISAADVSRKISQLDASSMIVIPRVQSDVLVEFPAIGNLMRKDFTPVFRGAFFAVYRRKMSSTATGLPTSSMPN